VKPNRPEVPFYSSTLAIRPEDTTEGSKGRFSFGETIPEKIEVPDDDRSLGEDGSREEELCQEKELEHLDAIQEASIIGPGPSPTQSETPSITKGSSLGNEEDEAVLKKAPHPVRITASVERSQTKSIPQPTAGGAFSAVDKSVGWGIRPPVSQPTKVAPVLAPSGLSSPSTKEVNLFDFYVAVSFIVYKLSHDIIVIQMNLHCKLTVHSIPSPLLFYFRSRNRATCPFQT